MDWKSFAKQKIFGTSQTNEYVCLRDGIIEQPLCVFLEMDDHECDVTANHLLLSYSPLIIALPIANEEAARLNSRTAFRCSFRQSMKDQTEFAWLVLKKSSEWEMGEITLMILTGVSGKHRFLSGFHQSMNRAFQRLRPWKPEDGSLAPELYDQVRIAYAIPRQVCIISLGDGGMFNFFPTDLHGEIGKKFYAGGLRKGGKACEQVERLEKLVLSSVSADSFSQAYSMGKNHMRELRAIEAFPIADFHSEKLDLPLPAAVVSYKELQLVNSIDAGIHRIHFYEVIHARVVNDRKPALAHIHKYYAQWRINQGLKTKYFFR